MKGISFQIIVASFLVLASCEKQEQEGLVKGLFFKCQEDSGEPFKPELYQDLQAPCLSSLIDEGFSNNNNGWFTGNSNNTFGEITGGIYTLISTTSRDFFFGGNLELPESKSIQVEATITLQQGSGTKNNFSGLTWAGKKGVEGTYEFSISNDGTFKVGLLQNSQYAPDIIAATASQAIVKKGTNKLTVRVFDAVNYFFINEKFVGKKAVDPIPLGNFIGIKLGAYQSIKVDDLRAGRIDI